MRRRGRLPLTGASHRLTYGVCPSSLTPAGVTAPSLDESRIEVDGRLRGALGTGLSLALHTPQGQFSGLLAVIYTELGEAFTSLANAVDPLSAIGEQLRALGRLLGIEPEEAKRTAVTATLSGVAGTSVEAGSRAPHHQRRRVPHPR